MNDRFRVFGAAVLGVAACGGVALGGALPARSLDSGEAERELAELKQHVYTLSSPYFEGRSARGPGGERAAEYVEHFFAMAELEPAFEGEDGSVSYLQRFDVPGDLKVTREAASWTDGSGARRGLEAGEDFTVLGVAGEASATGPLAFVGYSIEEGRDGYTSYGEDVDLSGRVAVLFRFEPMDAEGESKWSRFGRWTNAAGLASKINAAVDRGAAGVILVHPPAVDDPRAEGLPAPRTTRVGRSLDVPAIALSRGAADALLRSADPEGRSLMAWRLAADEGEIDAPVLLDERVTVTMSTGLERLRMPSSNVGGVLRGQGALADEWVILGAHYDHVGYGYVGGAMPGNQGKLHPGADDNASGTAALIMLAERLGARYRAMDAGTDARSILFLAFGAEEMGLLGASHYVENTEIDADDVAAMLNMDMIGRVDDNELEISGVGSGEGFEDLLTPMVERSPLDERLNRSGVGPSDHAVFYRAGVPVLHFFSGTHPDYHRPSDHPWLVNYEGLGEVVDLVEDVTAELATRGERLAYVRTTDADQPTQRFRTSVRLGIAPATYADDELGVPVGDVYPDTSAAVGGMKAGDRIIRWNGEEVADIMGMMEFLSAAEPGDEARIVVERDGEEKELKIILQARGGGG